MFNIHNIYDFCKDIFNIFNYIKYKNLEKVSFIYYMNFYNNQYMCTDNFFTLD